MRWGAGGGHFVRAALALQVAMFLAKSFDRFCSARTAGTIARVSRALPCKPSISLRMMMNSQRASRGCLFERE